MISLSLYLIICWNVSRAAWVFTEPSSSASRPAPLPHMIASSSKLPCGRPRASWRMAVGETNQKTNHITRAHLPCEKPYRILSITFLSNGPPKNSSLIKSNLFVFLWVRTWIELLTGARSSRVANSSPEKPDIHQTRFTPSHHWTGIHRQVQDKQFLKVRKLPGMWEKSHHFYSHAWKFSPN